MKHLIPSTLVGYSGGVGGQFVARNGMLIKLILQSEHDFLGFDFTAVNSSL